jgi:glutathione synthase/RimK-type ligase-like ATP-grasp enzyme
VKVLITCPRAPISIEWIRIFNRAGIEVILVDSLNFPIAKYYNNTKFVKIASPRLEFEAYKKDMIKLIHEVDWVIPNCEDIFYLSKVYDSIETDTFFFMPMSSLLFKLHHKFNFFELLNEYVKFPKSKLLTDKSHIKLDDKSILKPVFSRFGRSVIRNVTQKDIDNIKISDAYPWVQQERINGEAICNYALILDGKVLAHTVYKPKYLLNNAAATYFEPYYDERLEKFIEQFAKDTKYTGQVAFDFIDDGVELYVIECNPRATSGLHLMGENLEFVNNTFIYDKKVTSSAYRIGVTLFTLFGVKAIINGKFKLLYHDYKRAKDVLEGLPIYAQFLSMFGMFQRSLIYRKDITSASTFDIEYDG